MLRLRLIQWKLGGINTTGIKMDTVIAALQYSTEMVIIDYVASVGLYMQME